MNCTNYRTHVILLVACALPPLARAEAPAGQDNNPSATIPVASQDTNELSLSTGYDFTSGKYDTTDKTLTNVWNVAVKDSYGDWTATLTIPYEMVKAPAEVTLVNGKPKVTANEIINKKVAAVASKYGLTQAQLVQAVLKQNNLTLAAYNKLKPAKRAVLINNYLKTLPGASGSSISDITTNSGIGDVEFSVDYDLYNDKASGWDVSLTGTAAFGTASVDKGLGTGKNSYSPSLDISRTLGKFTPEISVGYEFVGKPDGTDLKDYVYGTVGCTYDLTDDISLSATYSISGPSSDGASSDQELIIGYRQHVGKSVSLDLHGIVGLSMTAPDVGFGGSVQFTF